MGKLLRIIESLILAVFFGFLPVLLCVAAAGFVNVIFLEEKGIAYLALAGLVVGLIIDTIFVRSWVKKAYQMNNKILAVIYLFYSVLALGMAMGVPIFNFTLGIAAGVYAARKMHVLGYDEEKRNQAVKKMALFCAAVMVLICCLITLWAIAGQMIGYRFETPIVSFTFTVPIFFAVVLTGGAMLVLLQYWLTRLAARVTYKVQMLKAGPKIAAAVVALLIIVAISGFAWIGCQAYQMHKRQAARVDKKTSAQERKSIRAVPRDPVVGRRATKLPLRLPDFLIFCFPDSLTPLSCPH